MADLPDDQRLALELQDARFELNQRDRMHAALMADMTARFKAMDAELATLRLIVTEKFARDIEVAVKPEDAADVAKWAQNPEAVRYLIAQTPYAIPEHPETEDFQCRGCGEEEGRDRGHRRDCPVAAAWRALGDPRATDDIDILRDPVREEEARWLENPEAVRELLKHTPVEFDPMESYCSDCHRFHDLHHFARWPSGARTTTGTRSLLGKCGAIGASFVARPTHTAWRRSRPRRGR